MTRLVLALVVAVVMAFACPSRAFAQLDGPSGAATGPASSYVITVEKFELCTGVDGSGGGCEGPFVLASSTKSFDIASASAGAEVGAYVSNVSLPVGTTYRYVRLTLSRTFTIAGHVDSVVNIGGTGNCRTGGADATGYTLATEGAGLDTAGTPTAQQLNLPNAGAWGGGYPNYPTNASSYNNPAVDIQDDAPTFASTWPLAAAFTVTADHQPTIKLAFDTQSALGAGSHSGDGVCHLGPQPPTIHVSIQ